jgi:tetratricopeptide (TPR) repeat protein
VRSVPLGIAILFVTPQLALSAADTGVPAGWSALQYDNYGNDLLNKQKYAESRKYFDAAIRIEPNRWTAYYNRATAFRMEKNWNAAIKDLNETIRLQPAFFQASWDRALTYEAMGDYSTALKDLNALAKVTHEVGNPYEMALTLNQRAWLRAVCSDASFRNGKAAVEDAKKACDLIKWKSSQYIDTLAAASAEAGDFDAAVRYQEQAINLKKTEESASKDKAAAESKKNSMQAYGQRLELYKHRQPCRETPGK